MSTKEAYLKTFLQSFNFDLPEDEVQEFVSIFQERSYKKGDHLVVAGEVKPIVAIVLEGLVRFYFNTFEGKEFNQTFVKENMLVMEYWSGLTGEPAQFSIQAIEDSKVLIGDYKEVEKLYDKHRSWDRIGRMLLEQNFLIKYRRETSLLLYDAKERYIKFTKDFPDLTKRLSQQDIALYLGVNPSTLNRLLKNLEKN